MINCCYLYLLSVKNKGCRGHRSQVTGHRSNGHTPTVTRQIFDANGHTPTVTRQIFDGFRLIYHLRCSGSLF